MTEGQTKAATSVGATGIVVVALIGLVSWLSDRYLSGMADDIREMRKDVALIADLARDNKTKAQLNDQRLDYIEQRLPPIYEPRTLPTTR